MKKVLSLFLAFTFLFAFGFVVSAAYDCTYCNDAGCVECEYDCTYCNDVGCVECEYDCTYCNDVGCVECEYDCTYCNDVGCVECDYDCTYCNDAGCATCIPPEPCIDCDAYPCECEDEEREPLFWWEWLRVPTQWVLFFFGFGWLWIPGMRVW